MHVLCFPLNLALESTVMNPYCAREEKMDGKTILITASTDGIGKQTAFELAEMGARVIVHGRKESRAKRILKEIEQKTGKNKSDCFNADLASLDQIRTMGAKIRQKYSRLDRSADDYHPVIAARPVSYRILQREPGVTGPFSGCRCFKWINRPLSYPAIGSGGDCVSCAIAPVRQYRLLGLIHTKL